MGTEVPYVRLFVPIVEIDSDREPKVKQWERKRACIKENPDLFDVDTTEEDHEEAARICAGCEGVSALVTFPASGLPRNEPAMQGEADVRSA